MAYTPTVLPQNPAGLARYVELELSKVADAFDNVEGAIMLELNVEPDKRRNGMLRFADGVNWNPGSGRGIYWYDGDAAAWVFLG